MAGSAALPPPSFVILREAQPEPKDLSHLGVPS